MKKIVLVLFLAITLSACGTPNVRKDYALGETTGKGLVVGSLTRSKSNLGFQGFSAAVSGIGIHYRHIGTGKRGRIEIDSALLGPLYSGDFANAKGELFVVELSPGSYVFEKWSALQGSYTSVTGEMPAPIEFRVLANKAVYLGNLNLEIVYGRNLFGIGIVAGGKIVAKDARSRDIVLLKKKYPNIAAEEVVYEIAESASDAAGKASRETPLYVPTNL